MEWTQPYTDLLLAGEIQGVENQIEATRSMIADQQARQEQLRQQVKHVQDSIDSQLACVMKLQEKLITVP